jgi:crotonobetainyl-CoA:carnitine CoA-transferase CaiB-like acyl-CoA transferase
MAGGALSDVVVLELATGIAGPYCGKLLADLGAQVVKVEPPTGDPTRKEGPLVDGDSAFFNWLNMNKLGAVIEPGDARIQRLAAHANIVIHNERGPEADALDATVKRVNPQAVIVSLTPYGRSGPRSGWHASPLTEWATGGYHYFGGDPNREPIALPGYQAEFHGGMHAAAGALAGLWHVREGGEGQVVEVSHQEAVLSDHAWLTTMWSHQGKVQMRTGSLYARCADGFVFLFNLAPYPNLFVLMERFDLLEDEELPQPLVWMQRFPEVFAAFREWAATRTKQEIYHACQELRIAASPVNTMEDVAESAQLAEREWFQNVEAGGKDFTAPGFPYKLTGTPCHLRWPAPRLGAHTEEVLSEDFTWAGAASTTTLPRTRERAQRGEGGRALTGYASSRSQPLGGPYRRAAPGRSRRGCHQIRLATKPATRARLVADDLWPRHATEAPTSTS